MVSGVGPRNCVLGGRADWSHLATTVEQLWAATMSGSATMGGDAAHSQITLGNLVMLYILRFIHPLTLWLFLLPFF